MTLFYAVLFYLATLLFVLGLGYRIYIYARTPAPLKIPTTPAPMTHSGVVLRMMREVLLFESLFKSNKWIWIFGYLFHIGLLLVILRHVRYFQADMGPFSTFIQPFGIYGAFAMVIGLTGLWVRRIFVERIRYITSPSDHLMLALLVGIGISGLSMTYITHTDIIAVKSFILGLITFNLQPLPTDTPLLIHLLLVVILLIIFPFSKLLHAPGIFFSPTRNQVDNSRQVRHVTPWATGLDE